jgi:hypothetical protein
MDTLEHEQVFEAMTPHKLASRVISALDSFLNLKEDDLLYSHHILSKPAVRFFFGKNH